MNKAYQFPQDEPNPFAEANAPASGADANPYAAGSEASRATPPSDAYQATLPSRAGKLLALGIGSLVAALISAVTAFWCLPLGIFVLMFSVPAVSMASHDLKAMKMGAMADSDRGLVIGALATAIVASVICALSLLVPIGMILLLFA